MGKFTLLILCCLMLTLPVQAAEKNGQVALTFDGCPEGIPEVLSGQQAKGTFFLPGSETDREACRALLDQGHEIGLDLTENDLAAMSRREIAGILFQATDRLPADCHPKWMRPDREPLDALRQVAAVTGHAYLTWSMDAREQLTRSMINQIRSGDVIALKNISPAELQNLIEILKLRGLETVTVSELAKASGIRPVPGSLYQSFH